MGMLTAVVILVAFGTLIQRVEVVQRFLGGETPLELRADEATARPDQMTAIDVLANDAGLEAGAAERLTIVRRPACGQAIIRDGMVHYLADRSCAGAHSFLYGLDGREGAGQIRVTVAAKPEEEEVVAAAGSDDAAADRSEAETPVETLPAPSVGSPAAPESGGTPDARGGTAAQTESGDRAGETLTERDAGSGAEPAAQAAPRTARTEAGDTTAREPEPSAEARGASAAAPAPVAAQDRTAGEALAAAPGGAGQGGVRPADASGPATPETSAPDECNTPPTLTLDVKAEGVTVMMVDAPCDAGSVAALA